MKQRRFGSLVLALELFNLRLRLPQFLAFASFTVLARFEFGCRSRAATGMLIGCCSSQLLQWVRDRANETHDNKHVIGESLSEAEALFTEHRELEAKLKVSAARASRRTPRMLSLTDGSSLFLILCDVILLVRLQGNLISTTLEVKGLMIRHRVKNLQQTAIFTFVHCCALESKTERAKWFMPKLGQVARGRKINTLVRAATSVQDETEIFATFWHTSKSRPPCSVSLDRTPDNGKKMPKKRAETFKSSSRLDVLVSSLARRRRQIDEGGGDAWKWGLSF